MSQIMTDRDREDVRAFILEHWHTSHVCIRGRDYHPDEAEGFIARSDGAISALVTYVTNEDGFLILTQNSTERGSGIGSSMVLKVIEIARQQGARRVWLTTSNANLDALGFYQRMGFRLAAVYRDALRRARAASKPEIPEFAPNGLAIHDELELELVLEYSSDDL